MTRSDAGRHAPMVSVLLLLIVTPTRAGADGAQDAATGLALDLRAATGAAAVTVNRSLIERLSFGLPDRTAFEAASVLDGAMLATQSPPHATAASNDIPEPEDDNLNRVGLFLGATTKTNGKTEFSIGVEYERRFHDLLGAGLVVEWEPSFEERVLVAPALFVHPVGELLITVAPGAQFEEHSTHFVFRLGAAWEFELAHGLALAPTINYDFVESAHDAISYGLVLSFSF